LKEIEFDAKQKNGESIQLIETGMITMFIIVLSPSAVDTQICLYEIIKRIKIIPIWHVKEGSNLPHIWRQLPKEIVDLSQEKTQLDIFQQNLTRAIS